MPSLRSLLGFSSKVPQSPLPKLNRVEPSRTTLVTACPCERQNAYLRNKTVDALEAEDVAAVARRYLQTRRGEQVTRNEAVVWGALYTPLNPHCFVNIKNTRRYKKTKRHAKSFLQARLGDDVFQKLQALNYDNADLPKATAVLRDAGVDVSRFPTKRRG